MISMSPSKGTSDIPVKAKMDNPKNPTDESRSFLHFSRENLSASHSDLEQGFNNARPRIRRDTVLSLIAILLASFCIGLEIWKILGVVDNPRCCLNSPKEVEMLKQELEIMKQDVEGMKHRILEEDLLNDLKAFEEQVEAEEFDEGIADDDTALDSDDYDYDSVYDIDDEDEDEDEDEDPMLSSQEYLNDYHTAPYAADYSGPGDSLSPASRESDLDDFHAALQKTEADSERKLEKSVQENRKNINRERMLDEGKNAAEIRQRENRTEENEDDILEEFRRDPDSLKIVRKRSVNQEKPVSYNPSGIPIYAHSYLLRNRKNFTWNSASPTLRLYDSLTRDEKTTTEKSKQESTVHHAIVTSWDKYPPKKYHAQTRAPTSHVLPPASYSSRVHSSRQRNKHAHRSADWQNEGPQALTLKESTVNRKDGEAWKLVQVIQRIQDSPARHSRPLRRRGMTRRHLRGSRQIIAAHYSADSSLFTGEDEHVGNGKGKHGQGIFKAWRATRWMNDLGMNGHFTLADGQLTIQETGLYLIYAQIHYLDRHDENGFRVLVNNESILQCMVYSPGTEHKSRSCFSAQAALLQAGDRVVLKDVGEERYTLFQHDKSFFGLVKLGETRPPRQQSQN
ncbi:uncharacterized protein egr isoform X1 [Neodiprion pinetum]|uniref:uncharacterized protein egr isoform X1 n=1 Tax=Neodiprion pinetum TaxID=441929 RepID=UPI001EDCE5BE|nr:uncharacterized protein LOC124215798 isoform X1 [Neodiprion pinetum]